MSKKNRNIIIALVIAITVVFLMIFSNLKNPLVRRLQGPVEGTDCILTVDGKLSAVSKNNHLFTWQWNDLSVWPVVARPDAQIAIPVADNKVIYIPLTGYSGLVLSDFKSQKEIARLDIPYGSECEKIKLSANGKFGAASILFKEGTQKGWFKLGVFDSDLKGISFVFQKDTAADKFQIDDFDVSQDGRLLAGAGYKEKGWIFVTDTKNGNILWEKTFNEYDRFTLARFSPDGKTLFAAEKVRYIIVYDSTSGQNIKVFEMPLYNTPAHQKQNISCIAISPDGRILAADSEPARRVWLWDIKTGREISSFTAGELTISSIAFSPDSRFLATGCLVSPEIKIWKVPQLENNQ